MAGYKSAGVESVTALDPSPFDPEIVFVWAPTMAKAVSRCAEYFREELGLNPTELKARPTGLTAPSQFKDEMVSINEIEQRQPNDPRNIKLGNQGYPAQVRWLVQPR